MVKGLSTLELRTFLLTVSVKALAGVLLSQALVYYRLLLRGCRILVAQSGLRPGDRWCDLRHSQYSLR